MTKSTWLLLIAAVPFLTAQSLSQDEQASLQRTLSEGGNSPTEFMLGIEKHLKQFPNSPRRAELERAAGEDGDRS